MTTNILTTSEHMGMALRRYLVYIMGFREDECNIILMGQSSGLSQEVLGAKFWLIDAWNFFNADPEGFRTAHKLAGKIKCLLLFYHVPDGFPEEGPFWCNPITARLSDKINEVLRNPPPSKADFEHLISLWPALANEPKKHHHSHHHSMKR